MGQIRQLLINIPPRTLKSLIWSVAAPAWLMGNDPAEQILCGSHAMTLAYKFSVYSRMVMESIWYNALFPNVVLAHDQNEKSKFMTTQSGQRMATSVDSKLTGDGGNWLILDDPNDPKGTKSDVERDKVNEWVDLTWGTRKNNPKTCVEIVIQQRLHVNDVTGHLLEQGGWEHLVISQEFEKKSIFIFPISKKKIVKEEGALLHPERVDRSDNPNMIPNLKKRLGEYGYAGQHVQRPFPKGGDRVKMSWFPRHRELPKKMDEIILSSDTASKAKEVNDPSVIQVYGRVDVQWYFIYQWKKRVAFPELESMAIAMGNQWKPDAFLIEDKSSGIAMIQVLRKKTQLPIIAIEPEADKITRFDTQTPSLEAGLLSLPDPVALPNEWMADVEANLSAFPNPNAWDELDAMSQFLKHLRKRDERTAPQVRSLG